MIAPGHAAVGLTLCCSNYNRKIVVIANAGTVNALSTFNFLAAEGRVVVGA
jgi:hypothetical protein